MSLYGSLFAGVSALNAQSQSMGMISDNIANVNTVGYKRSEASFDSLVTTQTRSTAYSPGAVRASTERRIGQQGIIQQSRSTTDLAISGNGFFVVRDTPDSADLSEAQYTRAGAFSEDAQGFLVNTANKYLMGWPIDENGNIPTATADIGSLEPVNVAFLGGVTRPTTQADIALNLNAGETPYAYPLNGTESPNYERSLRVYDSLGQAQEMTFRFTHHSSPTATAIGSVDVSEYDNLHEDLPNFTSTATYSSATDISGGAGGIAAVAPSVTDGDTFVIELGGQTQTITIADASTWTDTELITAINTAFGAGTAVSDGSGGIDITASTPIEIREGGSQPLTQSEMVNIGFGPSITYRDPKYFQIDLGGTTSFVSVNDGDSAAALVAQINAIAGVHSEIDANGRILIAADATGVTLDLNAVAPPGETALSVAEIGDLGFNYGAATVPAAPTLLTPLQNPATPQNWWQLELVSSDGIVLDSGSINFNGDGSINSATNPPSINLTNISWGNGSDPQNITVDLTNFSQYSGDYNVLYTNQNGAELGLRTGVTIDRDGVVTARFSNGEQSDLYQLALATFANVNGLTPDNGNVYSESSESGEYNLREAGQGGAGLIESSATESSNVDLADEFSKMIVTQRAYSAGTKVINTSDQMLEELLRLR